MLDSGGRYLHPLTHREERERKMRSQPPGKNTSGKKQAAYWECVQPEARAKLNGWLAGPCCGTYLHFLNRKGIPCREMMTEGKLACEHCMKGLAPQWRGYVPYYDSDYLRKITVITQGYYELAMELRHLETIQFTRGAEEKATVRLNRHPWRLEPIPMNDERSQPVDIMPYLVDVLWCDIALSRFHHDLPATPSLLDVAVQTDSVKTDTKEQEVEGAVNRLMNGDGATFADVVTIALGDPERNKEAIQRRNEKFAEAVKKPHANGKHKKGT